MISFSFLAVKLGHLVVNALFSDLTEHSSLISELENRENQRLVESLPELI
jgi:hypothetical protein